MAPSFTDARGPALHPTDRVVTDASPLYQQALEYLRLLERFPQPDRSIADYGVARGLLLAKRTRAGTDQYRSRPVK